MKLFDRFFEFPVRLLIAEWPTNGVTRHFSTVRSYKTGLLIFCTVLVLSCVEQKTKNENSVAETKEDTLFTILSEKETNISFKNALKESPSMNGLVYEYFYNGAGVGVGDVNGDGLIDIYFISNLNSNKLYLNQGGLKFLDATGPSGTKGGYGFPTGVTMVDINADGKLDMYVCKTGKFNDPDKRRNELYVNQGNNEMGIPIFKEQAKAYGLDLPHFSTQAAFFDYDHDGDIDMFLLNHGLENYPDEAIEVFKEQKSKFRGERLFNNQNGQFVDVTEKTGIINNMLGFGLGLAIGDINNDGWPDIAVGHDYSGKDHIYINQKNGTFKEVVEQVTGHTSNFSMGNDIADYNNDGWLDLVSLDMMSEKNYDIKTSMSGMDPERFFKHINLGLHYQYMYNTLQLNNGVEPIRNLPLFSDVAQLAGISSTDWSWGPLFFDMDNDGFKDLFVANGIKRDFRNNDFRIYRQQKQDNATKAAKSGQKINQNTFVTDLLSKMPTRKKANYFYLNRGDLTFTNQSSASANAIETSSNGAAYADFDNDGDLDIVVNNSDDASFIYRNNAAEIKKNNYLQLHLNGDTKNTLGIGMRAIAVYEGKRQVLEQYLTRGFQSSSMPGLHFGLGDTEKLDSLILIWPKGNTQILTNVKTNQVLELHYEDAEETHEYKNASKNSNRVFEILSTKTTGIQFVHKENDFNDFEKETLLPHRMSQLGPALAIADVNGDGLDDFYIGGAMGQSAMLYVQDMQGKFEAIKQPIFDKDKKHEDTSALFFDADGDGDQDIYVVSGGYEMPYSDTYYQDRLYLNTGQGQFTNKANALPKISDSGSKVTAGDFDSDGDFDLFVGTRVKPTNYGAYTKSYLLENKSETGKLIFEDVTEERIPDMLEHPMITDAKWADINKDGNLDLILANEWGNIEIFTNQNSSFTNATADYGLEKHTGWWYSISVEDIDQDGDLDLIAGNLGLNYKYKASENAPFFMYVNDFDDNHTEDIVLGYTQDSIVYPLRGRQCSSDQMPFIKKKFESYDAFAKADITEVYGEKLNTGTQYKVTTFASGIFRNNGTNGFDFEPFDNRAQLSSVNRILVGDYNEDNNLDIVLLGNMYGSEVETPRNDAGYGLFLHGQNGGEFQTIAPDISGLFVPGDVKEAKIINLRSGKGILVAKNNDGVQMIKINKTKK